MRGDRPSPLRRARGQILRAVRLMWKQAGTLKRAGADLVVAGEGEVALAMTEHLLSRLGATAEQRERVRVREGMI